MSSNLIIGLVELEYKDEKVGYKKISVGVYILKIHMRKVMFIIHGYT